MVLKNVSNRTQIENIRGTGVHHIFGKIEKHIIIEKMLADTSRPTSFPHFVSPVFGELESGNPALSVNFTPSP